MIYWNRLCTQPAFRLVILRITAGFFIFLGMYLAFQVIAAWTSGHYAIHFPGLLILSVSAILVFWGAGLLNYWESARYWTIIAAVLMIPAALAGILTSLWYLRGQIPILHDGFLPFWLIAAPLLVFVTLYAVTLIKILHSPEIRTTFNRHHRTDSWSYVFIVLSVIVAGAALFGKYENRAFREHLKVYRYQTRLEVRDANNDQKLERFRYAFPVLFPPRKWSAMIDNGLMVNHQNMTVALAAFHPVTLLVQSPGYVDTEVALSETDSIRIILMKRCRADTEVQHDS